MPWARVYLVVRPVRVLCPRPYPGHPKGCPNYSKKPGCPPAAPMIGETVDTNRDCYVVYNVFRIGEHAARMKAKHPKWSERQLYCCLYWQPRARKELRAAIREFSSSHPGLKVVGCPEAQGVNVTETMQQIGVKLEWPPRKLAYQVVVAGPAVAAPQSAQAEQA